MKLKSRVGVIVVSAAMSSVIFAVEFADSQANPDPRLIEGAKKEGEVIFYTTMTLDQSKEVVDRFQKKISVHQADPVSHRRRPTAQ